MEQVLRPAVTTGMAAVVVGAGLIATTPAAPTLPLQQANVQLTSDAIDAVADIPNAASGIVLLGGDMFYALGSNLEHIGTYALQWLNDVLAFKLADAVHDVTKGLAQFLLLPENLLLGVVGFLTGDDMLSDFYFLGHGAPIDPNMFTGVWDDLQSLATHFGDGLTDLFQGHLGLALDNFLISFNYLAIEIPEQLLVGATSFIWQDLLGLP